MRVGEKQTDALKFVSKEEFNKFAKAGEFIEFREKLHGNMYGTPK